MTTAPCQEKQVTQNLDSPLPAVFVIIMVNVSLRWQNPPRSLLATMKRLPAVTFKHP
jgi:hypothetical protein